MRALILSIAVASSFISVCGQPLSEHSDESSPKVDLDYTVHAASFDEAGGLYTFKNIRYGDPPVGDARFQHAKPVSSTNRTVNDGSIGFKCPQAYPEWALKESAEAAELTTQEMLQVVLNDPLMSEDCLFLDVVVPEKVFETRCPDGKNNGGAPVLIWIHGGGYVLGHKDEDVSDPSGLISRSQINGSEGVIFVAINYRLGLFGWLNGLGDEFIQANAGLQDQRLALEWIKKYIRRFGGDPNRLTLLGHSAGAGSIMHHITAENGERDAPFQQAIIQSPGWEMLDNGDIWPTTLATASEISGKSITSGAELAALNPATLKQVNAMVVFASANGSFTFGPTIDNAYVTGNPDTSLLEGRFVPDLQLMVGHNANEAGLFVPTTLNSEEELLSGLSHVFENFYEDSVKYILQELYPPPPEADGLYSTQYERACMIVSEASFTCHTRALGMAFGNSTWSYRFDVPPAIHMQDLPWTFFHKGIEDVDKDVAEAMQLFMTTFAEFGHPNQGATFPTWPKYGDDARSITFGPGSVELDTDDARSERCDFWLNGEYRK